MATDPFRTVAVAAAIALAGGLLAGCSQGGSEVDYDISATPSPTAQASSPAPTSAPESSAPASPTADTSTASGRPEVVETIATDLEVPWGLDFLPDGDAVVTERDSTRVLRLTGPRHRVQVLGTIDSAAPRAEAGLLGVAVSPTFSEDRRLFLYVSTGEDNRVVRTTLRGDRLGPLEPILTGIPVGATHDGGRLEFGPDGHLYVSTGETGEPALAQDRDSLAGKILRITPDGDPAPGNPFDSPVYSWGHRNVQGLAFVGDRLWASEFGDQSFDELNLVQPGENYGWPDVEGTGGTDQGYVDPQATWDTDEASPSGLAHAAGHLWLAALRGERLWRIPVDGDRAGEPRSFLVGRYGRMRTVALAPDGRPWLTTSNHDGRGDPAAEDDRILAIQP